MLIIKFGKHDTIEKVLKRYKKKVSDTKQLQKLRSRQEFVKPSVTKRKQKSKAIYVQKKWGNEEY